MIKKGIPFVLLWAASLYIGAYTISSLQNTPDRAAQRFVQAVTVGDTTEAYRQLAPELTKGREAYWQDFLKQFQEQGSAPRLTAQQQLKDAFNTHPEHGDPRRFIYVVTRGGQPHRLTIVMLKIGQTWKVVELSSA